jgi:hypothetical protein
MDKAVDETTARACRDVERADVDLKIKQDITQAAEAAALRALKKWKRAEVKQIALGTEYEKLAAIAQRYAEGENNERNRVLRARCALRYALGGGREG